MHWNFSAGFCSVLLVFSLVDKVNWSDCFFVFYNYVAKIEMFEALMRKNGFAADPIKRN